MSNSDDDEEEEIIVYANFEEGTVEKELFQMNPKLKIIGLDSHSPIVQLRDSTFKGEWNDTIGTKLLLAEDSHPEQVDQTFTVTPEIMLKCEFQCTKTLDLSRIFLKPKSSLKVEEPKEEVVTEANTYETE